MKNNVGCFVLGFSSSPRVVCIQVTSFRKEKKSGVLLSAFIAISYEKFSISLGSPSSLFVF